MATPRTLLSRFFLALGFAAVTTVALAWLMQSLIHSDADPLTEAPPALPIEWVRVPEPEELDRPDPPKPPTFPDPPPEHLPERPSETFEPGDIHFTIAPPPKDKPLGPRTGLADGDLLPIVAVEPAYPERARQRGIEGSVVLEFTVSAAGQVQHPRVLEALPPGIFDRAALQAITRFRYRPRMVGGTPQPVHGVRTRLRFAME